MNAPLPATVPDEAKPTHETPAANLSLQTGDAGDVRFSAEGIFVPEGGLMAPQTVGEGRRNKFLFSEALRLQEQGIDCPETLFGKLKAENEAHCRPPKPEKELLKIVRRVRMRRARNAGTVIAASPPELDPQKSAIATPLRPPGILRGSRYGFLRSSARRLRKRGFTNPDILFEKLKALNAAYCNPPKPERDLRNIAFRLCGHPTANASGATGAPQVLPPNSSGSGPREPAIQQRASDDARSAPSEGARPAASCVVSLAGDAEPSPRGATQVLSSRGQTIPSTQLAFRTADGAYVESRRVHRADLVQQGHSPAEQIVYQILYNAGSTSPGHPGAREVQMGYDRLARKAAITKRNIISIMKRLEQKLALEILQEQDSARQIARRYRVFGMAAILERRRRVGMLYVIRHGGVEFVFPQTSKTSSSLSAGGVSSPGDVSTPGDDTSSGAELSPGDRPSTIPGDRLTADPGDAVSPLLRTTRNPVGTSTASAIIA